MNNNQNELPTKVLLYPHWRINFRPKEYQENLIPSLSKCYEIIEKTKLSLRGWDYPHLSRKDSQRGQGNNWVASWSDLIGRYEYWRFYQSGQFFHLFNVREAVDIEWGEKLKSIIKSHLFDRDDIVWENITGFISIINFIYTITEIYEFATRLCQAQIYTGSINIKIEIKGIKGFVLVAPWDRAWFNYYTSIENILSHSIDYEIYDLLTKSKDVSLSTIIWFFERFGWMSPSENFIRQDQENLLKGQF